MRRRARTTATRAHADVVGTFEELGYSVAERRGPLDARLERPGHLPLRLRLVPEGRIFGGSFALEVAAAEPLLPETGGLSVRPRGVVRLSSVGFRARSRDERGAALAARLSGDERLLARLVKVHFERIRVEPDGRPVIRHMGGSVVWVLFPPLVRAVPLVAEQAHATVAALEAFADAGGQAGAATGASATTA